MKNPFASFLQAFVLFFSILGIYHAWGMGGPLRPPPSDPSPRSQLQAPQPQSVRQILVATAAEEIGVTEATGNNDGARVEAYLSSVGLHRGDPYCAAFVYFVGATALGQANPFPRSGWSPDMVTPASKGSPRSGDTFGIYFPSKGRISHTGLIAGTESDQGKWAAPRGYLRTIEANTSGSAASGSAADRDGEGVFSKLRPTSTVRQTKSFLP